MIRQTSIIVMIVSLQLFIACGHDAKQEPQAVKKADTTSTEPITGERINGPANIREKPGGDILFTLNDHAPVTCTEEKNGWYQIGFEAELPDSLKATDSIPGGTKIIIDGIESGTILKNIMADGLHEYKHKNIAQMTGYTSTANIYTNSIIENALTDYLSKKDSNSISSMRDFIHNFALDQDDQFSPFTTYYNYEDWIDDPSPLFRIQLVFSNNKLIGIVHSRKLNLPGTHDYKLERGFRVSFFHSTEKSKIEQFSKIFNQFVNSVD